MASTATYLFYIRTGQKSKKRRMEKESNGKDPVRIASGQLVVDPSGDGTGNISFFFFKYLTCHFCE